jgi:hypothetical protein
VVSFTPLPLYPEERAPGTHWIRGWVDPTAGLDDVEKRKFLTLPGLERRPLCRPARSQSLYQLRYPGSLLAPMAMHNLTVRVKKFRVLSQEKPTLKRRIIKVENIMKSTIGHIKSDIRQKYIYICVDAESIEDSNSSRRKFLYRK